MKVVSYNLRKHRAINELAALDERYSPDLICLQECDTTDLPQRIGHLELATSTSGNRLGLAVYYRPDRYEFRVVRSFALKKSLHDHLLRPAHERLIGVRLLDLEARARARRRLVPRGAPHRPELPASPPDQVGARAAAVPRARPADADGRRLQLPGVQGQPRREGARGRLRADAQRQPHVHAVQVLPRALRPRDLRRASTSIAWRRCRAGRPTTCRSSSTRGTRSCRRHREEADVVI